MISGRTLTACVLAVGAALARAPLAKAELPAAVKPAELRDVDIEQKLNAAIPLDADFFDESGQPVRLRAFFGGDKPVVLTLNYFRCPMLCGLQLQQMLKTLRELKWTAGQEFEILTVSFDALETPPLAKAKKDTYVAEYGRPQAARGWHFLTGRAESIRQLTRAVGFRFKWNDERKEWMHSTALIILTPDGRVSRYLGGLGYDAETLRLALVEASQGEVGSVWDQIFLWCAHYDDNSGQYVVLAQTMMKLAGYATIAVVGAALAAFWLYEHRVRSRRPARQPAASQGNLGTRS